jgi:molybdopterin synthase catalytic subunit
MHAVRVVGPPAERHAAADRLIDRLSADGSVAIVGSRKGPVEPQVDSPAADAAYAIGPNGTVASGDDPDLGALLDRLAEAYDYAVVVAADTDPTLPAVAIGDRDHDGPTVGSAPDAEALDLGAVVEELAVTEPRETLASLVAAVEAEPAAERSGAIATFTGRVRARDDPDDPRTERLEFEKYGGVADDRMAAIRADLEAREGVLAVRLHHRVGVVEAGEHIVHVVVLAGHRGEAFRAVEDGIDRLKEEAPIFKKEVTADGDFWVHDRP